MAKSQLKEHIKNHLHHPAVFHHMISGWPAASWDFNSLQRLLGDQKIQVRICQKGSSQMGVQWETHCKYEEVTMEELSDWLKGKAVGGRRLEQYPQATHCIYADYKYMAELFNGRKEVLKAVNWDVFGFDGRDGQHSTIWIGSTGAHTPCHYDTYGCNLVAQIQGRKQWFLYPPDSTSSLYPTRLPYEESSVFSCVNVRCPDLDSYPEFKEASPWIVTLEPGQVLYVPKHWWHYVESVEPSISINTWIELECDNGERVSEAICRTLVTSLMTSSDKPTREWLNPTEVAHNFDRNVSFLEVAIRSVCHRSQKRPNDGSPRESSTGCKRLRLKEKKNKNPNFCTNSPENNQGDSAPVWDITKCVERGDDSLLLLSGHTTCGGNTRSSVQCSTTKVTDKRASGSDGFVAEYKKASSPIDYSRKACYEGNCALCKIIRLVYHENWIEKPAVSHLEPIAFNEYYDKYIHCPFKGGHDDLSMSVSDMDSPHSNTDESDSRKEGLPEMEGEDSGSVFTKFVMAVTHPDTIDFITKKLIYCDNTG